MFIGRKDLRFIDAVFIGESGSMLIWVALKMEDVRSLFLPTRLLDWLIKVESWSRVIDKDSW